MDQNQNSPKEQSPKQQVIDALKNANNVLVTISRDPSVDQLAACVGLTLMMNKLDKHATAVFSGAIPSTLEFLQPEKTIETNTDSLRDFIISLDKSKADKLRYKVEDDVVRIYITPYRTSISASDLDFTQGNFNVDVVVALGISNKDELDGAILEHGQILHDATVIDMSAGAHTPVDMGAVNWHDETASSLCEMLVSISEAFKTGLLDSQMATAYLTGIVAETDRFSNDRTTPKVMTMSAQLMAAGANQQLIANQLAIQPEPELPVSTETSQPAEAPHNDGELVIERDEELPQPSAAPEPAPPAPAPTVAHDTSEVIADLNEEDHSTTSLNDVEGSLGVSGTDVTDTRSPRDEEGNITQPPEIEIDEHGNMVDLAAEAEEKAYAHKQKVIQPLNIEPPKPKTDLSHYSFDEQASQSGIASTAIVPEVITDQPTPEQTLADLERAVGSPHVTQEAPTNDAAVEPVDSTQSAPDFNLPAEEHVPSQPDVQEQVPAAPTVPPPFVPPYMQPQSTDDELNLPQPQ